MSTNALQRAYAWSLQPLRYDPHATAKQHQPSYAGMIPMGMAEAAASLFKMADHQAQQQQQQVQAQQAPRQQPHLVKLLGPSHGGGSHMTLTPHTSHQQQQAGRGEGGEGAMGGAPHNTPDHPLCVRPEVTLCWPFLTVGPYPVGSACVTHPEGL